MVFHVKRRDPKYPKRGGSHLTQRFIELQRSMKSKEPQGHQKVGDVPSIVSETCTHPRPNISILEGTSSCKLFLDIPYTRVVRVGTVHNTLDSMLHNARIPPNHVKVAINIAIENDALLPIPLNEDIITLGGIISTYVAWTVHLVDLVPIMAKGIAEYNATSPPRVEYVSKKAKVVKSKLKENKSRSKSSYNESSGEVVSKKTNYCAHLMKHVQKLLDYSIIIISFPLPVFGYLYDNLISKNIFVFLCPHSTTLVMSSNEKRKNEQAEHVAKVLINHKEYVDLFIAPINIGLTFPNRVHMVSYEHRTPCQSNDKDCGYYVMNFMKEIIKQWSAQVQFSADSYTDDQINQIKEDWSKYIREDYVLIVQLNKNIMHIQNVRSINMYWVMSYNIKHPHKYK
ncbi:hypothetical protein Lal_00033616 [Lupinus albus]|nr:hypothetical protein Lal_00033616 [Lupinus albus]